MYPTQKGIFQQGLKSHGKYYAGDLYLTANPSVALQYPDAKTMPADWDRELAAVLGPAADQTPVPAAGTVEAEAVATSTQ